MRFLDAIQSHPTGKHTIPYTPVSMYGSIDREVYADASAPFVKEFRTEVRLGQLIRVPDVAGCHDIIQVMEKQFRKELASYVYGDTRKEINQLRTMLWGMIQDTSRYELLQQLDKIEETTR